MIDPTTLGGTVLSSFPLSLEYVRDIEEFEGPLLSEFKGPHGETFIYFWCDADDRFNRWLVVRTPPASLFRYLVGKIDLRELVCNGPDQFGYVVDLNDQGAEARSWYLELASLPDE